MSLLQNVLQVDATQMQLQALQDAGREDEAAAHTALLKRLHTKLQHCREAAAAAAQEEQAAAERAAAEFARSQDLDERSERLKMMGESMAAEIDQLKVVRDMQVSSPQNVTGNVTFTVRSCLHLHVSNICSSNMSHFRETTETGTTAVIQHLAMDQMILEFFMV